MEGYLELTSPPTFLSTLTLTSTCTRYWCYIQRTSLVFTHVRSDDGVDVPVYARAHEGVREPVDLVDIQVSSQAM